MILIWLWYDYDFDFDFGFGSHRMECTLFGTYVEELNTFLSSGDTENAVVIVQFAKVKNFQGIHSYVILKFFNFLFSISQYFNLFVWSNMLSVENNKDVGWWLILFFPTLSFFLHLVQIKCICRTAWHALSYFLIHHVMRLSNWRRGICLCFLNILHYLIDMMHYKIYFQCHINSWTKLLFCIS